jgi:kynurenine---oxoglutarate transaminase / cysteine-S-conjugate beta-lyase / glutamine---phenylpyruvate transaminase
MGREINPANEVLVTVGAYGSLFNAFTGFLNPGDEVIIIEPFFDCYEPMAVSAGGVCKFVPLKPKLGQTSGGLTSTADWGWDDNELEAAFTSKTKVIIINCPNNPLGKVYTQQELEKIAELCIRHNVICISDEVYEHITYDRKHLRIATLPGMWERTITVGSAGKTFSTTGAKIGWTIGCKELIRLCQITHNNSIYCGPTFIQEVLGRCFDLELSRLDSPECYFNSISTELRPKRDMLAKLLVDAGLTPIVPEGGYFMLADISKIAKDFQSDENERKDSKFVKYLIREKGLATIPVTAFYTNEHKHLGENYIRFCFFKDENTLQKAAEVLKQF